MQNVRGLQPNIPGRFLRVGSIPRFHLESFRKYSYVLPRKSSENIRPVPNNPRQISESTACVFRRPSSVHQLIRSTANADIVSRRGTIYRALFARQSTVLGSQRSTRQPNRVRRL